MMGRPNLFLECPAVMPIKGFCIITPEKGSTGKEKGHSVFWAVPF